MNAVIIQSRKMKVVKCIERFFIDAAK